MEIETDEVIPAHLEPREPFTPAPWIVNDDDPDDIKVECGAYDDETPGICGNHSPEWKLLDCDARLIAAAPRMLKALQAIVAEFGDENPDDDWKEVQEARAAVAEALGHGA